MPEGSDPSRKDSAGPTLGLFGVQQELALEFYYEHGPVRVVGTPVQDLHPCLCDVEPFDCVPRELGESLHLASVRLFCLAHGERQLRQVSSD